MNQELILALNELEYERGISKETLLEAIEAALISAYRRNFGTGHAVTVHIDRDTGELEIAVRKEVVEEVEDPELQMSLEEAKEIDPGYKVGDTVEIPVAPQEFGRIAAQTAKQVVVQRIREAERDIIYDEFASREGDIVTGIVQRVQGRNVFIDLGKLEAVLLPSEQIPGEFYRQGDRVKTYIVEVKKTSKGPQVVVSRSHPGLLKRLFELEVPEIHDGVVEIRGVAREAGARSKIAVYSSDPDVDPVGACVGHKGMRVQTVVNELKGEKIDIIKWSDDPEEYVANALSPSRVSSVRIDEAEKVARVIVPDYQLSLAIGKAGQNARLAAKLTGWRIDIRSESQLADEAMKTAARGLTLREGETQEELETKARALSAFDRALREAARSAASAPADGDDLFNEWSRRALDDEEPEASDREGAEPEASEGGGALPGAAEDEAGEEAAGEDAGAAATPEENEEV